MASNAGASRAFERSAPVTSAPRAPASGLARIAADHRGDGHRIVDAHNNVRSRLLSARLGGAHVRLSKHYRERVGLIVFKRPAGIPAILEQYAALGEGLAVDPLAAYR